MPAFNMKAGVDFLARRTVPVRRGFTKPYPQPASLAYILMHKRL